MTTLAQLRKTALSLAETSEGAHDGTITFSVRDKRFASLDKDKSVQLHLPAADADEAVPQLATAERTSTGFRVSITDINGQALNYWVRRAWLAKAPKQLAAKAIAADAATPGAVGDLPKSIGRPATQALVNAGITSLADVAKHTEAELLALHGMGPKAVRILKG